MQGKTFERAIIDVCKPPTGSMNEASLYVCFSRITDVNNLLILRPWAGVGHEKDFAYVKKHLTTERNTDFLKEMKRLKKVDAKTVAAYGEYAITIKYSNCNV